MYTEESLCNLQGFELCFTVFHQRYVVGFEHFQNANLIPCHQVLLNSQNNGTIGALRIMFGGTIIGTTPLNDNKWHGYYIQYA